MGLVFSFSITPFLKCGSRAWALTVGLGFRGLGFILAVEVVIKRLLVWEAVMSAKVLNFAPEKTQTQTCQFEGCSESGSLAARDYIAPHIDCLLLLQLLHRALYCFLQLRLMSMPKNACSHAAPWTCM